MAFKPVPIDFEKLTNQAPVWDGGTVSKDTTFKGDVTVEGSLTANSLLVENGAEINGGLSVVGGLDVAGGFSADQLSGQYIYIGDQSIEGSFRFYLNDNMLILEQLVSNEWIERQAWGNI